MGMRRKVVWGMRKREEAPLIAVCDKVAERPPRIDFCAFESESSK